MGYSYGHPIIMPSLRSVYSVNPTNLEAGLCSLTYTLWSFVDVPLLLAGDRWNFQTIAVLAILGCPIDVWMNGGRDGWTVQVQYEFLRLGITSTFFLHLSERAWVPGSLHTSHFPEKLPFQELWLFGD